MCVGRAPLPDLSPSCVLSSFSAGLLRCLFSPSCCLLSCPRPVSPLPAYRHTPPHAPPNNPPRRRFTPASPPRWQSSEFVGFSRPGVPVDRFPCAVFRSLMFASPSAAGFGLRTQRGAAWRGHSAGALGAWGASAWALGLGASPRGGGDPPGVLHDIEKKSHVCDEKSHLHIDRTPPLAALCLRVPCSTPCSTHTVESPFVPRGPRRSPRARDTAKVPYVAPATT
jgi:hypothetical protein